MLCTGLVGLGTETIKSVKNRDGSNTEEKRRAGNKNN